MKLVECVPNISEGRNRKVIDAVVAEAATVEGVRVLDVDPGAATNRTVITLVGEPEPVLEAAFRLMRKAGELIDMRQHKGEHPRNGATDVCPFVPLAGVTMEECAGLARRLGQRVGAELGIPVYLYEHAASRPEWKNLANIRAGEYEALATKLGKPEWKPDFGPNEWNERSARTGATQIGARQFLIAYNINLATKQTKIAKRIGMLIREQGGAPVRGPDGKTLRDAAGALMKADKGLFTHCKATGWYIAEYSRAQVTMNLTDFQITPPHLVFDAVVRLAEELGCRVTGSEIVGLVPLEAILAAGRHYLDKQGASAGVPESDLVAAAVLAMGLEDVTPFLPAEKIVEYRVAERRPLVESTVRGFVDELSRDSAAPGGGSVAALAGSLAAALAGMVANLTIGKKGYDAVEAEMRTLAVAAQEHKERLLAAIDDDTFAFNKVMDGFAMPKGTPEEKARREAALAAANKQATLVPLGVLERVPQVVALARAAAERGNAGSLSDAGVAGLSARTAARGAFYNVMINLAGIGDPAFVAEVRGRAEQAMGEVATACDALDALICAELARRLTP